TFGHPMSDPISRRRFVRTAAGAAALAAGANSIAAYADGRDQVLAGLDDYCQQAITEWKVPGLAIGVIRDGKLLLARGYGVRKLGSEDLVTENTVFPIASCTKSFTAAMVGKLVDQRKLRWDGPITRHVPGLVIPTREGGAEPTLRHALQHRSGLPTANMLWRSGE